MAFRPPASARTRPIGRLALQEDWRPPDRSQRSYALLLRCTLCSLPPEAVPRGNSDLPPGNWSSGCESPPANLKPGGRHEAESVHGGPDPGDPPRPPGAAARPGPPASTIRVSSTPCAAAPRGVARESEAGGAALSRGEASGATLPAQAPRTASPPPAAEGPQRSLVHRLH